MTAEISKSLFLTSIMSEVLNNFLQIKTRSYRHDDSILKKRPMGSCKTNLKGKCHPWLSVLVT